MAVVTVQYAQAAAAGVQVHARLPVQMIVQVHARLPVQMTVQVHVKTDAVAVRVVRAAVQAVRPVQGVRVAQQAAEAAATRGAATAVKTVVLVNVPLHVSVHVRVSQRQV